MNKSFLITFIVLAAFLSACTQQDMTDEERCIDSGGSWFNPCETGECYTCSCMESSKQFKVLKNGRCEECKSNEECGQDSCAMGKNQCIEETYTCQEGLCSIETKTYSVFEGPKTHECTDGRCIPCEEECVTY